MENVTKLFIIINIFIFSFNKITCDPLVPCESNNKLCMINLLETAKHNIEIVVNELGIDNTDALDISNVVVDEADVIYLNVSEGVLEGINTCVYNDVKVDVENSNGFVTFQCNITSRGIYNAVIKKPKLIGVLINTPLNCNGPYYNIDFYNIKLTYNFSYKIVKDDENTAYMRFNSGTVVYNMNNEGHKVVYGLTGVHSGNEDVSDVVNKALNKNWRPPSTIVVGPFFKAIIGKLVQRKLKYFSMIPVEKLVTDNIEKYTNQEVANDGLNKQKACLRNDGDCHLELIRGMKEIIAKGVPELDIPKLNKLILKNLTVALPDLMDFTLLVGSVTGGDKCVAKSARFDFGMNKFSIQQHCDLVIKGTYTAFLYANATLSTFGGQSIQAHGNTEVKLKKLPLNATYDFNIHEKGEDKNLNFGEAKVFYDYNVPGHSLSFKLDGVFLGSLDISDFAMNILNDNWKFFAPDFGPTFVLAVNGLINDPLLKYLSHYPVQNYFDDSSISFVQ